MKKIFTLLAFLVVTANAVAQNPITYLDVSNQDNINQFFNNQTDNYSGDVGIIDDVSKRLNVTGYILSVQRENWDWVSGQSTLLKNTSSESKIVKDSWKETRNFKGYSYFYGQNDAIYSTYSSGGTIKSLTFYITNCSGIEFFLYHNTANSGTFTITATPSDGSSPVNITEVLGGKGQYFPSIYDLDKSKSYTITLAIPFYTCLHEISFLLKDYRKFETTIGNSNWATMYLDFPVRIPKTEHQNLDVFTIEAIDNDNRVVTGNVYDYIPANTGVLLHEDVTNHETITFIETGKPLDGIGSNWLKGTTIDLSKADNYGLEEDEYALTLGYNQGNLGFFVYKGETIGAYKAFLVTSDFENFSKGFYISDFEEFTDIQTVESECTETGNWYSLQGVRLNARPTQRGIYLNNGKKVFVK